MAKLSRSEGILGIEKSIQILEGLRRFFIEVEAGEDSDEVYMQELLDGLSDIANQRVELLGDSPLLKIRLKQPDVIVTVLFDLTVDTLD
jgi:hypothetical protein